MSERLSAFEWAQRYCGDPQSWGTRGYKIVEFLQERGMTPDSKVLEIGSGNLSQGKPLLEFLEPGNYCGLEPNGILVEAALAKYPQLETRLPRFSWGSDFDSSEFNERIDFVVAHSVLSHAAHRQMEVCLARVRAVVDEGDFFLASLRLGEQNTFAPEWCYPHVSWFRLESLQVIGFHTGWQVEQVPDYKARLEAVAPNDTHHWVLFTAALSAEEQNQLRQAEEARQTEERTFTEAAAQRKVDEAAAHDRVERSSPPAPPISSDVYWLSEEAQ